jgi:glutamate-1-semialdehyde 2,1-aminomutase
VKIYGSYHGHHDTVMVSIGVEYDKDRRPRRPRLAPLRAGSRRRSST